MKISLDTSRGLYFPENVNKYWYFSKISTWSLRQIMWKSSCPTANEWTSVHIFTLLNCVFSVLTLINISYPTHGNFIRLVSSFIHSLIHTICLSTETNQAGIIGGLIAAVAIIIIIVVIVVIVRKRSSKKPKGKKSNLVLATFFWSFVLLSVERYLLQKYNAQVS